MKNIFLFIGQLFLIWLIYAASEWIVKILYLPIPGSVFGMMLLFFLLLSGVLKVTYIEKAASFLMKHLAFFFIPFAVGLMNYGQLIKTSGIQLLIMIAVSTVIGMVLTSGLTQVLTGKAGAKREQSDHH